MADEASRPLLEEQVRSISPNAERAARSNQSGRSFTLSSESTPLLHRRDDGLTYHATTLRYSRPSSATSELSESIDGDSAKKRSRIRWPTVISLVLLTTSVLVILIMAFAAPAVVKQYAQEAATFEPKRLSIESTTPDGVRARVQGDFVMNSAHVKKKTVRDFGRFVTWIAKEIETDKSEIDVHLPDYGNVLVGSAALPSIKLNIRNGHHNKVDFLTDLRAGDMKGIHGIATDWIEGRLGRLNVKGEATLHLKTGLLNLGTQVLTDTITFEDSEFPSLPNVDIMKLNVHDAQQGAMAVDVLLAAMIDSPIALTIPALGFQIYVPNCSPGDPFIMVADATTAAVQVQPGEPTEVNVKGLIKGLPEELTTNCPGRDGSPLDTLVLSYIQGLKTTVYVRGTDAPSPEAPAWIVDLLRSVTVPLPFTGHALDNLVKNFSMANTHFSLPDPFAEPGTPEAQPTVSALVKVLIAVPKEMNFRVDVPRVRAFTNVFYKGKNLGNINIDRWQDANSTLLENQDGSSGLLVEFSIQDAPLQVTDDNLLAQIVQQMLFGGEAVVLHVAAAVDTKVQTGLGSFAVHGIPAEGDVRVKTLAGNSIEHLNPRVIYLQLGETTGISLLVSTRLNFTNPTEYSATIPLLDVLVLYNNTALAHVIARNISVAPGKNTNVSMDVLWNPSESGGIEGIKAGRALLSSYISGFNTTVTLKSHEGTFPSMPELGKALSAMQIDFPLPTLSTPGSPDDGGNNNAPHFIEDATVYLWSSTAQFTLFSPLSQHTITITSVDATAFYEENDPVGQIDYNQPFDVPPGHSTTPRLPVDLDLGGVGYDALRKALGQSMKLDAVARVGVEVARYRDVVYYRGKGIAAKVRI